MQRIAARSSGVCLCGCGAPTAKSKNGYQRAYASYACRTRANRAGIQAEHLPPEPCKCGCGKFPPRNPNGYQRRFATPRCRKQYHDDVPPAQIEKILAREAAKKQHDRATNPQSVWRVDGWQSKGWPWQ